MWKYNSYYFGTIEYISYLYLVRNAFVSLQCQVRSKDVNRLNFIVTKGISTFYYRMKSSVHVQLRESHISIFFHFLLRIHKHFSLKFVSQPHYEVWIQLLDTRVRDKLSRNKQWNLVILAIAYSKNTGIYRFCSLYEQPWIFMSGYLSVWNVLIKFLFSMKMV